jgi:hypothetical protein
LLWPILRLTHIVDGVVVVAGKVVVGMAMVGEVVDGAVVDGAVVVEVGVEERAVDGEEYGIIKITMVKFQQSLKSAEIVLKGPVLHYKFIFGAIVVFDSK